MDEDDEEFEVVHSNPGWSLTACVVLMFTSKTEVYALYQMTEKLVYVP